MTDTDFKIYVPEDGREIASRLRFPAGVAKPPLIIMATGLYSYMDKESQEEVAQRYLQAGFSVLQFNFMGHGYFPNKSDGDIQDITLSSSINDLTAVWNYARDRLSGDVDMERTVVHATSYGSLTALMALEQRKIAPNAMISISPYSFYKLKPWALPLSVLGHTLPDGLKRTLKLNIPVKMLDDFRKNHSNALKKKGFMGSTAISFFVGADDKISSPETVQSWTRMINYDADIGYLGGHQARYTIYPGVKHFVMPKEVGDNIFRESLAFIEEVFAAHGPRPPVKLVKQGGAVASQSPVSQKKYVRK